jgi:LPXTG-motif cell wall-anchored protein
MRAAGGLGTVLLSIGALAGMMALVIRKGPIGALTVILIVVAAVTLLSGIAAIFGKKKKKNG